VLCCADVRASLARLPLFVRNLHEQAHPFDDPEAMPSVVLPDGRIHSDDDLVHFDS
jgi:hypothetical protein